MEAKTNANGMASSVTATLTVWRVVHASVLLDFGGEKVLTDPWFSQKRGFPAYYWGEPLGIALADLPGLSGVVSSHGHYDHYDMEAFAAYPDKKVPFVVKRGTGGKARAVGFENVGYCGRGEGGAFVVANARDGETERDGKNDQRQDRAVRS